MYNKGYMKYLPEDTDGGCKRRMQTAKQDKVFS